MQIKLGNTVLADDANNRATAAWAGPTVDSADWSQQIQTSLPIGAANARLFARGGVVSSVSFSTTWRAASMEAASAKVLSWQRDCPRSGTLTVDSAAWGAAVVETLTLRRVGVTIYASYVIRHDQTAPTTT